MNIRRMIRAVAEGQNPSQVLEGRPLNHSIPKVLESRFRGDELERLYGEDFTPSGKVNEFPPIDTGHGIRIRNITVRKDQPGEYDYKLPHANRSRVYVTKSADERVFNKAFDAARPFFKGEKDAPTPADMLHDEGSPESNILQRMMDIRRPENNPHQAYRELVLPHVFKHLEMTGQSTQKGLEGLPHAQWHVHAGCAGCPCSPGFIVQKSDHPLATGHDIHVTVD